MMTSSHGTRSMVTNMLALLFVLVVSSSTTNPSSLVMGFVVPTTSTATTVSRTISTTSSTSTTKLFISSWGAKGGATSSRWTVEQQNPEENVQAYVKEPAPVEVRNTLNQNCLVSGLANAQERTDQYMFDMLNNPESAYEFQNIICFCQNAAFSKKRLLSRSARYTGLLDKLTFMEPTSANANTGDSSSSTMLLPTVLQLENVSTWVAYVEDNHMNQLKEIAQIVTQVGASSTLSTLKNIAVLLVNATSLTTEQRQQAVMYYNEIHTQYPQIQYTLMSVGQLEESKLEGQAYYEFDNFTSDKATLPSNTEFSRQEAYRIISELIQLESGTNQALVFAEVYNQNKTSAKLIKGLRQAGYVRLQELDHMISSGVSAYEDAIEQYKVTYPDAVKGYTTNAWWETEQFQQSRRKTAERDNEKKEEIKNERLMAIEKIANEYVKREYYKQSMMVGSSSSSSSSNTAVMTLTEEEFKVSIWDRALLEGEMKYRQWNEGEIIDESMELATFSAKQERKKLIMLQKAKQELADVLGEDVNELEKELNPPETDKDKDSKKNY